MVRMKMIRDKQDLDVYQREKRFSQERKDAMSLER